MQHPIGRHHRRCRSLTEHLWALFALALASVLDHLFIPSTPPRPVSQRDQVDQRHRTDDSSSPSTGKDDCLDPDLIAGALVRPYLAPFPRPRVPIGDLLAAPEPNEFDDLTKAIRTYLRVCA